MIAVTQLVLLGKVFFIVFYIALTVLHSAHCSLSVLNLRTSAAAQQLENESPEAHMHAIHMHSPSATTSCAFR